MVIVRKGKLQVLYDNEGNFTGNYGNGNVCREHAASVILLEKINCKFQQAQSVHLDLVKVKYMTLVIPHL